MQSLEIPWTEGLLYIHIRPPQKVIEGLRTSESIQIQVIICMNSVLVHF